MYKIPRTTLLRTTFSTLSISLFSSCPPRTIFISNFPPHTYHHFSNSILFSRSAHQSHSHHHHRQIAFKHLNINFLLLSSPSTGTSSSSDSVQAPQQNFPCPKFCSPHFSASHHQFFHLPLIISASHHQIVLPSFLITSLLSFSSHHLSPHHHLLPLAFRITSLNFFG